MNENKNSVPPDRVGATPAPKDVEYQLPDINVRQRITRMVTADTASTDADATELDRLARRYSREMVLAAEGALYWAVRWPFELMAGLVQAGRKFEEEYYRPTTKRRISLHDDEL